MKNHYYILFVINLTYINLINWFLLPKFREMILSNVNKK